MIHHLVVSQIGGTPLWMFIMENPFKVDDLGAPPILEEERHRRKHRDRKEPESEQQTQKR